MEVFEAQGNWWLPQFPDHHVAGSLKFDPTSGATLSTIGDTFTLEIGKLYGKEGPTAGSILIPNNVVIPIIHGYIDAGTPVTLWQCRQTGGNWATGFVGSSFSVAVVFDGHHFHSDEDIVFDEVELKFTLIDTWLGPVGLSGEVTYYTDGRPKRVQYAYDFTPSPSYSVNGLTVRFLHELTIEGDRVAEVGLVRNSSLEVQLSRSMNFSDLQHDVIYPLRNFLALATGTTIIPERVRVQSPSAPVVSGLPTRIEMYYPTKGEGVTPRKIDRWDMLLRFEDVEDDFGRYLGNWIAKSEQLRPVMDLYFSLFYIPSMYVHLEFLTLAQALETFHRRSYTGEYIASDEFSVIKNALLESLPALMNEDLRKSIEKRVEYLNEYSLRKRLKHLLKEILKPYGSVIDLLIKDQNDFVDRVVDMRNYLTHYSGASQDNPHEQYKLAQKMRVLMQLCFCIEMGLPSDTVTKLVSETRDFRNWRS